MTEQDRLEELPIQFPKVTKKELNNDLDVMWVASSRERLSGEYLHEIQNVEPHLGKLIYLNAEIIDNPTEFELGAWYVSTILERYNFPQVSEDTLTSLFAENEEAANKRTKTEAIELAETSGSEARQELLRRACDTLGTIESFYFDIFAPLNYAEENPVLMVWLASQSPSFERGGMIVYVSKRRQFFSDQLKETFGE